MMTENNENVQVQTEETALTNAPGTDLEVISFYDQALKLFKYAEVRSITTIEDAKLATDDLSAIARLKKAMKEKREFYLAPLREKVEEVNGVYKLLMQPIEKADIITREKILAYQKEQTRIKAEQEEINRLRVEAAQKEAALNGGEITEPVNLVEVAPDAPKRVITEMGTAGQRMVRKWEVEDLGKVPLDYLMIDAAKVGKIVRAGIPSIPGIRIYEEPILTVRAN